MRVSLYDYECSKRVEEEGYPFYALLGALMRQADTDNTRKLRAAWPEFWESMQRRYDAPMGVVVEWDDVTPEQHYQWMRDNGYL